MADPVPNPNPAPAQAVPIREYVADGTAVLVIIGSVYLAVTKPEIAIPVYLNTLLGVAGMYLFSKYTPNSV